MTPREPTYEGLGALLRDARVAQGLSPESLARELRLPLPMLRAIESDAWEQVPPGRERPLARQLARRLGVNLEAHEGLWSRVPGPPIQDTVDPRREKMERVVMALLTAGTLLLVAWLVVPGRRLKGEGSADRPRPSSEAPATWIPRVAKGPFPVLGELLPEAPVTAEGVLVAVRAMDVCSAHIVSPAGEQAHTLHVSEPWIIRVQGPFSLRLDNAGVATLEVAGRRILHGRSVGEPWAGQFDAQGTWIPPERPRPEPTAPEAEDPVTKEPG